MAACTIDTSKRYVLVVEDNTMISMILEELLKKLNYQAILAENGQKGVDKFTKYIKEG
jgi:DNA-binding response OmpR family regulator